MMTSLGLIELEKKDKFPSMIPGGKDETQLKNQLYIPGGGLSKAFHNKRYIYKVCNSCYPPDTSMLKINFK